jgi:hypothetical protein
LAKKLNDFSEVIFDTGMTARLAGSVAAMIRGVQPSSAHQPFFNLSL